jgi:TonB family protein
MAAYDRKDYAAEEHQFRDLVALLNDPVMGNRSNDLRTLAVGFVDLSAAAATPPPEPKKAEAAAPPPPPVERVEPQPMRIWTGDEAGVVPPVALRQEVPRVPTSINAQARERGLLELIIDEQGRVSALTMRVSIHPMYDPLLMAAARDWRYKPATVGGVPVKFRKTIQVTVERR